jgi:phosphate transport system permease protein
MTTTQVNPYQDVKPIKPWQITIKDVIADLISVVIVTIATIVTLAVTPMRGKLGFMGALFLYSIIATIVRGFISRKPKSIGSSLSSLFIYIAAGIVVAPVMSILYTIVVRGIKGLSLGIFKHDMSVAVPDSPLNEGGLLHALIGTLQIVAFSTIICVPIALLTALYLTEIRGRFSGLVRFLVQAMSGVPSIIAGLFIYAVVLIQFHGRYSGIAGALALSILMLPTVARVAEEVLKLIPDDLREAGLALGATQWRTVSRIVIPTAKSGLITAVILGVARIAGETAPIILTIGGSDRINWNLFSGQMSALPFYVWRQYLYGGETATARAWTGILVLMLIVMFFFTVTRLLSRRGSRV